ncbi:MAG: carboxymuconolactone decarboxylase family protein [Defluviicoccus sp.]|nr:carboxymuconolactone decarboxylase family protein [Defluviicoccus sp.]MDE0386623.1 carboxymuconolactone decarboxylase family protein [Defluviicoccus sp.]
MKPQRIPDLTPEEMDEHQRALFEAIAGPRGGVVRGPFAIWLRHPDLVEKANALGNHLRDATSLATHLSELAILVTARFWGARYEWYAHEGLAAAAGVDRAVIEAIREGREPDFDDPEQAIVYRVGRALYRAKEIPDETYREAIGILGRERTIDLVAVLGFYTMVAMTLNAFNAPLPDGAADPFA